MPSPSPAALKAEILTGPHASIFAPWVAAGTHTPIADWLNDPGGPAAATVALDTVARDDFLLALRPAYLSLPNLPAATAAKWDRILSAVNTTATIVIDDTTRLLLGTAITDGVLDQAEADTTWHRTGSYAEVTWGAGVTVTHADVSAALNS